MSKEGSSDSRPDVEAHEPELDPAFEVVEPARLECPIVLLLAALRLRLPRRFLESARLDAIALRRSEDAFVDDLFAGVRALGAPLIRARFPRAYLDLNREPYELDPRMFDGRLPAFANTRSVRVAGGLGTIARVVGESQEIYAGRLSVAEGLAGSRGSTSPITSRLADLLARAHRTFGIAVLIDCHSMPSVPTLVPTTGDKKLKTDFVVGDRYGTSSDTDFVEALEQAMRKLNYVVQRNKPYAGGYITENYGAPTRGYHAIQIEVNRSLYMDERQLVRTERFATVAADITKIVASLSEAIAGQGLKAAAE